MSDLVILAALSMGFVSGCPQDPADNAAQNATQEAPEAHDATPAREEEKPNAGKDSPEEDQHKPDESANDAPAKSDAAPKPASPDGAADKGAADKGAAKNEMAPTPDAKQEPAANGSNATAATGAIWTTRDFCYGDNQFGVSKISLADSKVTTVEPKLSDLLPSDSGRWYAYSQWDMNGKKTRVSVIDPDTLDVLYEKYLPDALLGLMPHPREKHLLFGAASTDLQTIQSSVIVDIAKGEIVQRASASGLYGWTSDGRTMRLMADGKRWSGALGEEEKELPGLELPEGYVIGTSWSTSPDNKQIVVHLQRNANGAWSDDLWIGSMNGGPLQRLTRTTISSYALWSPDGRFIAFNTDPDLHAACGISFSPERWHQNARVHYVDASARDVAKAEQMHHFDVLGMTGKYRLLGWSAQ